MWERLAKWIKKLMSAAERERLIRQLGSRDHHTSLAALARLREIGWLQDGSLQYANLRFADLHFADLREADLQFADLRHANLWDADLRGANLSCARLTQADLEQANFERANLRGANLWAAQLHGAIMPDGSKWTPETNMLFYTDPMSSYYGEPPAYGRGIDWKRTRGSA